LPRVLTAITSISRDHEQYLGSSLAGIAVEKAGIMAEGVPVILSRSIRGEEPDCRGILRKLAGLKQAPVVEPGVELKRLDGGLKPPHQELAAQGSLKGLVLPGRLRINQLGLYQSRNLEVSLALVSQLAELGFIEPSVTIHSEINAAMPARFEVHRTGEGWVVLDAAHNFEGMRVLGEAIREYFPGVSPTLVFGCQQGKDVRRMLEPLNGLVRRVVAIELPILHPLPLAEVEEELRQAKMELYLAGHPYSWQMNRLHDEVVSGETVVVAGSIYYLASTAEAFGRGSAPRPGMNQ
jgi:dihydrofolate synthase/folylpolyglutamate synthase